MSGASGVPTLTLVGGPTALITYGGLRILTDPTFDPPGRYESSGSPVVLTKLDGPAVDAADIGPSGWDQAPPASSLATPWTSTFPEAAP